MTRPQSSQLTREARPRGARGLVPRLSPARVSRVCRGRRLGTIQGLERTCGAASVEVKHVNVVLERCLIKCRK